MLLFTVRFFCIGAVVLMTPRQVFAQNGSSTPKEEQGFIESLIDHNRKISKNIDDAAKDIDIYLANQGTVKEKNKSKITLHNSLTWKEGKEFEYAPRLGIKLHLPNLQKKLQLRFTTYDEDEEERGINENRYKDTPGEKNVGTSLALFQDLGKVSTEFRPRVEFRDDEVETSYLVKFSTSYTPGDFSFDPQLQFFAHSQKGTGQFVGLNMDFTLTPTNTLTVINEEEYTDGNNTLSTNHGIRWRHEYNRVMSHSHACIFEANNRDTFHHERVVLSSTFSHKFYREVLHYSLTPALAFNKSAHYHPASSLNLKIEVIF